MSKLYQQLDDAVKELEQKYFRPYSDFSIGYFQCIGELEDILKRFKKKGI